MASGLRSSNAPASSIARAPHSVSSRGLEDEHHAARQMLALLGQHRGDAQRDRRVRVVPARVHLARNLRCERQSGRLAHRQRVHVGADRDGRSRLAAFEHRDDAGAADAGAARNGELRQEFLHALRRLVFLERKFGVRVDRAPQREHSSVQRSADGVDPAARIHGGSYAILSAIRQHVEYRVHEEMMCIGPTVSKSACAKARTFSVAGRCWAIPQVVEILSLAGFDYLVLDQEHGLGDATSLAAQLHAMSATPTVGVVRVPWNDHVYLKRVLDAGAEGRAHPQHRHRRRRARRGRRLPLSAARPPRDRVGLGARVELRHGARLRRDAAPTTS